MDATYQRKPRAAMAGKVLVAVSLLSLSLTAAACCRNYQEFSDACRSQGGIPSKNPLVCSPGRTYTPPVRDLDAERREAAEAERRRLAEERRVKEEAERRFAAFIRARDEDAKTFKGVIGTTISPNDGGLKGGSGGDVGMKSAQGSSGLKGSAPSDPGQSRQAQAWKQLHCAASISGFALGSLQTGNRGEFRALYPEALKALDGQSVGVTCGEAPPFPDGRGKPVDMGIAMATQREVLERAATIADRMAPAAGPQAAPGTPPSGPETPGEKVRRVQRDLNNYVNSQKVTGKTQADIDRQEKDRKDLAKLVLVNNGLEKGDLTSVGVNLADTPRDRPARRRGAAASSTKP